MATLLASEWNGTYSVLAQRASATSDHTISLHRIFWSKVSDKSTVLLAVYR